MPLETCLQTLNLDDGVVSKALGQGNATMYKRAAAMIYASMHTVVWGFYQLAKNSKISAVELVTVRVSYTEGTVLGLNWYDGDYNCWEGGPCYVHEAIDLGALTAGETKTASMNLGATLFAYKGNVCVKRVVVVEEGQHVQISAADVRTFAVGEKVDRLCGHQTVSLVIRQP